ncbi:MAG: hypothetical protein U0L11_08115 [Acutalibacteraceae bacterium]|nr:hypothetical protein [Acutalibacteraceae bacterium]
MANYNRSEAYDLSMYDYDMSSSAAPRIEQPVRKKKTKSAAQVRRESIASALRALKIFVVSATLITLFGAVLLSKVNLIILEQEATKIEAEINEAKSENTRLVMQLNSNASIEKVDAYAVSVLGMNKLERYQIHYFEDREDDKVVVVGGKAVANEADAVG